MIARASLVPIAERFPFFPVLSRAKNVAFSRQDEIRTNRQRELGKPFFEQIDGAARVDRPDRASILQLANQCDTFRVEYRFASTRHECSIKIDTEQSNG